MKFKTLAAASLAVATMLGMGACGSNSTANKTTSDGKRLLRFGIIPPRVMARRILLMWPSSLRLRIRM